jgi:hypothetical protein
LTVSIPSTQQLKTWETKMLSPHEFATLMLVKDATEQLEVDRADLDVLLSRQLVSLEHAPSGQALPRLTREGHSFLKAAGRIH